MPDDPAAADLPFDEQLTLRNDPAGAPKAMPAAAPAQAPDYSRGSHLIGTIGDFEVADKLGQGGMGAVYRARQI